MNGVFNELNPIENRLDCVKGLNGVPIRRFGRGRWAWGRTARDGGVVKANEGMILRKSVECIGWVCFLLLKEGWMQLDFIQSAEIALTPTSFLTNPC